MFKNNKGFSLIEILVTVGLIGILVSVAVPSYRNYKKGTIKMATRAEVGNIQKAYGAKYAIDSSYCHNMNDVGIDINKNTSPLFKNKGFVGFGAGSSAVGDECDLSVVGGIEKIQFISTGEGTCSVTTHTDKTSCEGANPAGTWTATTGTGGANAPTCILGTNTFKAGAYTDVSSLDMFIQADHTGSIKEHPGLVDCQ